MCKVVSFKIGRRTVRAAEIKKKYITNIATKAKSCASIDRVVLFGSALNERCTEKSDIDIAIFGHIPEGKMLRSDEYRQFVREVFKYDYSQNYDILYFDSRSKRKPVILDEINGGELLYEKAQQ